jgi:hypothetical protein
LWINNGILEPSVPTFLHLVNNVLFLPHTSLNTHMDTEIRRIHGFSFPQILDFSTKPLPRDNLAMLWSIMPRTFGTSTYIHSPTGIVLWCRLRLRKLKLGGCDIESIQGTSYQRTWQKYWRTTCPQRLRRPRS